MPLSAIKKYRPYISICFLIVLIPLTIIESWKLLEDPPKASSSKKVSKTTAKYEDSVASLQAKILIGGLVYFDRNSALGSSLSGSRSQLLDSLKSTLAAFEERDGELTLKSRKTKRMLQMDLILSNALGLAENKSQLCRFLAPAEADLSETTKSYSISQDLCRESEVHEDSTLPLDSLTEEKLRSDFSWLGELLIQTRTTENTRLQDLHVSLLDDLQQTFFSFLIALFVGLPLLLLSALSALVMLYRLAVKKAKLQFEHLGVPPYLYLEVFALYLFGMLCLPKAIELLGVTESRMGLLMSNVLGISGILLVALWPRLAGIGIKEIGRDIGLRWTGFSKATIDILFAPYAYFSSVAPFLVVLVAYSLVLTALSIDPSSGAHPVIPILSNSKDQTIIYLIVIMAVVVAPIVEEIMFRGFLYSWMRAYLPAWSTILLSAVLFAALHPQGAIGIVPLSTIGAILALIREWRNSLLTCMVTHALFNAVTLTLVISIS